MRDSRLTDSSRRKFASTWSRGCCSPSTNQRGVRGSSTTGLSPEASLNRRSLDCQIQECYNGDLKIAYLISFLGPYLWLAEVGTRRKVTGDKQEML